MTVVKPKPKSLLRPISTGANRAMNQSEVVPITCNLLKARENHASNVGTLKVQLVSIGFASNWLQIWYETFKPIIKLSNRNHVITFDGHLKNALLWDKNIVSVLLLWEAKTTIAAVT